MKSLQDDIPDEKLFKSGLSIGKSLTYKTEMREIAEKIFLDTPGLADLKMRQQAAKEITESLQQNGLYQIVFVVTLEAGRMRSVDIATINLVIMNAPEITQFGLIINKLCDETYRKFEDGKLKEILSNEFLSDLVDVNGRRLISRLLLLREFTQLHDRDDKTMRIPEFEKFMKFLPTISIRKENVRDIPGDNSLEELASRSEEDVLALRADNDDLNRQIQQNRLQSNEKILEMIEMQKQHYVEQLQVLENHYEQAIQEKKEIQLKLENAIESLKKSTTQQISQIVIENQQKDMIMKFELEEQRRFYETKFNDMNHELLTIRNQLLTIKIQMEETQRNFDELDQPPQNASFVSKVFAYLGFIPQHD